ncbi:L-rhamnose mutarotase [Sciscionella sediminilitoris]|uniref:L-rhamnose mutarotase n=1 Tax=Sciscionella sediminilitoris TaxID=1445613 RepID=UPI0004DEFC7E|nr:L-rhamnose mutarotase [Sciscionella sp. SE31]
MARAAFTLHIKPDKVTEYAEAHRRVWPEMREALRQAGFRNYSIFLDGSTAFGYFEAEDPEAALEAMGRTEVNARWQDTMAELLEQRVEDDGPGLLRQVFLLE